VRFTLSSPFVLWNRQTSLISILPKNGPKSPQGAPLPVGSGAFKFVSWAKDDRLVLADNPLWWGGAPDVKALVFRPVPSDASRTAALISGELNVVPLLPPSQLPQLEARKDVKIVKFQSNRNVFIGINVTVPVLADPKLRAAMNHAIDRTAITSRLIRGYGTPINQMVAPKVFGYDPAQQPVSYDPAMAKKLVGESAYKGEKIILTYTTNQIAYGDQVAQAVANYLQNAGIAIELQPLEAAATTQLSIGRKYPGLFMAIFGPSIMDADLAITLYFERGNRGYWVNDEVQKLAVAQRAEGDPAKRLALIGKIWTLANDDNAFLFLYNEIWAFGMSPKVDWTPAPDGGLAFQHAQLVAAK
jgi:ABC-type transport system substrate-binding protein